MDHRVPEGAACGQDGCELPITDAAVLPLQTVPARIDVISDAICPWCWIGKRNLAGALAQLGSGLTN